MENNIENKNESFEYTYSAKRQEEIEHIRSKYLPKDDDKMELLRKLDRDVTKPGMIWSIAVGVVGCLILGIGMSCVMVWGDTLFVPGIVIGIVGIAMIAVAYPIYQKITKKQREKLVPQILALTEELSK